MWVIVTVTNNVKHGLKIVSREFSFTTSVPVQDVYCCLSRLVWDNGAFAAKACCFFVTSRKPFLFCSQWTEHSLICVLPQELFPIRFGDLNARSQSSCSPLEEEQPRTGRSKHSGTISSEKDCIVILSHGIGEQTKMKKDQWCVWSILQVL